MHAPITLFIVVFCITALGGMLLTEDKQAPLTERLMASLSECETQMLQKQLVESPSEVLRISDKNKAINACARLPKEEAREEANKRIINKQAQFLENK